MNTGKRKSKTDTKPTKTKTTKKERPQGFLARRSPARDAIAEKLAEFDTVQSMYAWAKKEYGADLVYATSRAYFLFPFVNIGLMPDGGASMLIAASIGRARANALLMLGEKFRAPAAFNAGLVTEVLDDEPALQARVEEVVAKLAAKSSSALRTTKAAADAITMAAFEPALALELAGQTRLLQSVEFQQTLAAFAKPQA